MPEGSRNLKTIKFIHDCNHFMIFGEAGTGIVEVYKLGEKDQQVTSPCAKIQLKGVKHLKDNVTEIAESGNYIYLGVKKEG